MTRKHRTAHRIIWSLLALTLVFGFTMAFCLRPPIAGEPTHAAKNQ